jgi:hypothetical protein
MAIGRLRRWLSRVRWLRVLRRAHMYAGIVLMPWLAFFGISGVLFNHPNIGERIEARGLPPPRLKELTGFVPWQPELVSQRVVEQLNALHPTQRYSVDPGFGSRYSGTVVMKAPKSDGLNVFLLNPERGMGILVQREARPEGRSAPFAGARLDLPEYSLATLDDRFAGLLQSHGLPATGPLRADAKIAPKLEFRAKDETGAAWNISYDLGTSTVSGRLSSEWPSIGVSQLFSTLHTTHHYTFGLQARWFWALFQDLLGIAMLFWGVSGILMWWQLKATRVVGLASIGLALGIGGVVAFTTARDVLFGSVKQQLGPGE